MYTDSYFIKVLHSSSGFVLAPAKPHSFSLASTPQPRGPTLMPSNMYLQFSSIGGVYPTLCPILQLFVSCSGALAKCRKTDISKIQHRGIFKCIIKVEQLRSLSCFPHYWVLFPESKVLRKPVFSTKHFISNPKILTQPSQ